MSAKRYIIRKAITGSSIGQPYTTQQGAENAASRYSLTTPYLGMNLQVWWMDDSGVPKVLVALAYRGTVERTDESPIS